MTAPDMTSRPAVAEAREIALREVLDVISRSRDNELPVFNSILRNACRLCRAQSGYVTIIDEAGTHIGSPVQYGASDAFMEQARNFRAEIATSSLTAAKAIRERRTFRMDDIANSDLYREGHPVRRAMVDIEGIRSILTVPLLTKDGSLGAIVLYRHEVRPFQDGDVTLVEAFAAQAVIAIENVRQFRELQSRLEREAASREILSAISRSRADPTAVFEIILKNSLKLCRAPQASLSLVSEDGAQLIPIARQGHVDDPDQTFRRTGVPLDQPGMRTAAVREKRTMHIHDVRETEFYKDGEPKAFPLTAESHGIPKSMIL